MCTPYKVDTRKSSPQLTPKRHLKNAINPKYIFETPHAIFSYRTILPLIHKLQAYGVILNGPNCYSHGRK